MQRTATLERVDTNYDSDFAAWAGEQAVLLRDKRFAMADLENIIEELEGLAKTERRALSSQIGRVIEHLLKLIYSPARDPRQGWAETVTDARRQIEDVLEDSPSLRKSVDQLVQRNVRTTARGVARILRDYDELDRSTEVDLLAHSFTPEQVLGDWFPPPR